MPSSIGLALGAKCHDTHHPMLSPPIRTLPAVSLIAKGGWKCCHSFPSYSVKSRSFTLLQQQGDYIITTFTGERSFQNICARVTGVKPATSANKTVPRHPLDNLRRTSQSSHHPTSCSCPPLSPRPHLAPVIPTCWILSEKSSNAPASWNGIPWAIYLSCPCHSIQVFIQISPIRESSPDATSQHKFSPYTMWLFIVIMTCQHIMHLFLYVYFLIDCDSSTVKQAPSVNDYCSVCCCASVI